MARVNGKEVNFKTSKNLELGKNVLGVETDATIMPMNENSLDDMAKAEAISKYNDQVDEYVNKLDEHVKLLQQYTEEIGKDLANWVNGEGDPKLNTALDNYAETLGYNFK